MTMTMTIMMIHSTAHPYLQCRSTMIHSSRNSSSSSSSSVIVVVVVLLCSISIFIFICISLYSILLWLILYDDGTVRFGMEQMVVVTGVICHEHEARDMRHET